MDNRASYGEEQEQGQTLPEAISCSQAIVVGDVVKVTGDDSPRVTVTVRVSQWIRPDQGPSRLVFSDRTVNTDGDRAAWRTGGPLLAIVPLRTSESARTFRGKQLTVHKRRIMSGLKEARHTACPSPWAPSAAGTRSTPPN